MAFTSKSVDDIITDKYAHLLLMLIRNGMTMGNQVVVIKNDLQSAILHVCKLLSISPMLSHLDNQLVLLSKLEESMCIIILPNILALVRFWNFICFMFGCYVEDKYSTYIPGTLKCFTQTTCERG